MPDTPACAALQQAVHSFAGGDEEEFAEGFMRFIRAGEGRDAYARIVEMLKAAAFRAV